MVGHEVYFALQGWILDYPNEGSRQGFPFDPYLLYLQRRITRASEVLERVLTLAPAPQIVPRILWSLSEMLQSYLADNQVRNATASYEQSYTIFQELRTTFRLTAQGDTPLTENYLLAGSDLRELVQDLTEVREKYRGILAREEDENITRNYQIVLQHLDRYWSLLGPTTSGTRGVHERTTNSLESQWRTSKRKRRVGHGRSVLTLDFNSLPAEYMLVENLNNPRYQEIVLGSLDSLPEKLAAAGKGAKPFRTRNTMSEMINLGRLPKKIIRREDFLDTLVDTYVQHCQLLNAL